MLKIREEQLKVFEDAALQAFEDEMVEHGKQFSPHLSAILGDAQLRVAVRQAIAKAGQYGLTLRGPIRLFVELMFLCGSNFDTDPQYAAIGEVLRSDADQMTKAERIHEGQSDYLENVSGPNNINVFKAEEAILEYAANTPGALEHNLENELLRQIAVSFPQRAEYIGKPALRALIAEGKAEAAKFGFTSPRAQALIIILMSAFGHGCITDPLYPWINQTLADPHIVDANARAQRLERKALTWLSHVLARPREGNTE